MNVLKDSLFVLLGIGATLPHDRAVILMYHSVADTSKHFYSVSTEAFARHMEYLAVKRFTVISLSELAARLRERRDLGGAIVLTFDDGYRNNWTKAFPVLKKYGFPATIFVATDRVGATNVKSGLEYMREDEIKAMHASGIIDIEPHTVSHPKLARLSAERARKEIAGSQDFIGKLLGKTTNLFAYPYGNYNNTTVDVVKKCGFAAAVTVHEGTVDPDSKLFELPRNSIDASTTFTQFRGKVSRAVDRYEAIKRLMRTHP